MTTTPDRRSAQEAAVLELLTRGIPQHEIAEQVTIDAMALPAHLRMMLEKFHRRRGGDDFDDQLGAGVPRRPPPGGLGARTAAAPDGDAQREHPSGPEIAGSP